MMKKVIQNNDTPKMLQEIKHKEGMTIPDGYFDKFHESIMDEIENEKSEIKVISIRRLMAYAASMAFILVSMFYLFQEVDSNHIEQTSMVTYEVSEDIELAFEDLTVSDYYDELASINLALEDEIEF